MNIAGFSLSNWMTYGFSFTQGSISWRFPIAFQLVFSVILFSTIPWLPESPRWLLAHGFEDEGVSVLVALEGELATAQDVAIIKQKDEILDAVRIERENAPSWKDILHGNTGNTGMIRRLLLGTGEVFTFCMLVDGQLIYQFRHAINAAASRDKCNELLVSPRSPKRSAIF